ncbi:MAG: ketoacyl-ACP synthase III [Bacteroidota bacterium]
MAFITFNKVGIKAIAACVPKNISSNSDLTYFIPEEEVVKTINSIGIKEKRFADEQVTSSDLCYEAAEKLFTDNNIDRDTIDAVIFISQTPDYRQPATAPSLQSRLNLKKSTLSFDVNLACSGYVYGLSIAFSFATQDGISKVLLLVGETMSKTISKKDKITTPLFGDAGTATLIEKDDIFGTSCFSLNSDGSDAHILRVPYGGYRQPSSAEGFVEISDAEGNIRNGEQLQMEGMDVFNFALKAVPTDIKFILQNCLLTINDIDLMLFHQANKFMTDFLAKRLKLDASKIPYSIEKFGNTSSASIPLTIVTELNLPTNYPNRKTVMMSGFGAGLSWGTAIVSLENCYISQLTEY